MLNERDYYHKIRTGQIRPPSLVCFGFPRSGSTLLMRLLNIACLMPVKGDFDLDFYRSILDVRNGYRKNAIYGNPIMLEKENVFIDCYRDKEENQENRMIDYHLKNIILASTGSGFTKATIIGFGNDMLEEYVSMIRDMYSYDWEPCPLKIVWLTRNNEDCAESLWNKLSENITDPLGLKSRDKEEFKKININLLENQHKQFKECYELGDICITYDDIVNNPMETLMKFLPSYYPNEKMVKRVIDRKIS